MSEKPIIYNGEMVRAILAEPPRKSQTRRVIKYADGNIPTLPDDVEDGWPVAYFEARDEYDFLPCPYGQPGDRLWVRETFEYCDEDGGCESVALFYKADDGLTNEVTWIDIPPDKRDAVCEHYPWDELTQRWRPSIHMPRWASRITLEITGVRVERVQDISEADIVAEGLDFENEKTSQWFDEGEHMHIAGAPYSGERFAFMRLWDSINAKRGYGWDANPWVWVIEFRRVEPQ